MLIKGVRLFFNLLRGCFLFVWGGVCRNFCVGGGRKKQRRETKWFLFTATTHNSWTIKRLHWFLTIKKTTPSLVEKMFCRLYSCFYTPVGEANTLPLLIFALYLLNEIFRGKNLILVITTTSGRKKSDFDVWQGPITFNKL